MKEYSELLERAARLCSKSEKCSSEIRDKLNQWGMPESEIDRAITSLEKEKFIDDRRYAGYFVRDKLKFNRWEIGRAHV